MTGAVPPWGSNLSPELDRLPWIAMRRVQAASRNQIIDAVADLADLRTRSAIAEGRAAVEVIGLYRMDAPQCILWPVVMVRVVEPGRTALAAVYWDACLKMRVRTFVGMDPMRLADRYSGDVTGPPSVVNGDRPGRWATGGDGSAHHASAERGDRVDPGSN